MFFLFLVEGRVVIATTDQVRLVSESYICCLQPQDMLQLVPVVLNKQTKCIKQVPLSFQNSGIENISNGDVPKIYGMSSPTAV